MRDPISIRLGPGMSIFQYWQYEWAREFRMIQSMHTLSMRQFLKGKQTVTAQCHNCSINLVHS